MNKKTMLLSVMLAATQANAAGLDAKQIYFGGGLGYNDIGFGDNAVGFQVFAGLPIPVNLGKMTLSAEVGYMDSGSFDQEVSPAINIPGFPTIPAQTVSDKAKGLWGTAVVDFAIQNQISVIGRLGLDIGDDDGIMIGAGLGFDVNKNIEIRAEYVIRDHIDSLQMNLVFRQ